MAGSARDAVEGVDEATQGVDGVVVRARDRYVGTEVGDARVDERQYALHRGVEIDAAIFSPHGWKGAGDLDRTAVAAGRGHRRAHAGDAPREVVGVFAPRNPSRAEAREAPSHPLVDATTHPDRHAARLQRLRHHVDRVEREAREIYLGARLPPEGLTHLEREVELPSARSEVETGGFVLLALPSDAHTEIEAAAREHVEGRRRLGEYDGT